MLRLIGVIPKEFVICSECQKPYVRDERLAPGCPCAPNARWIDAVLVREDDVRKHQRIYAIARNLIRAWDDNPNDDNSPERETEKRARRLWQAVKALRNEVGL